MKIQTLLLLIFILLTGCVSIDRRVLKETADPNSIALISGKFSNQAMYRSTGEFIAIDNLAQLLSVPSHHSNEVTISFDKNTGLVLQFSDTNETKIVTFKEGMKLSSDGKFELPSSTHCSFSGGTLGCQGKSITLFVNKYGNLVTIQSGGGGGLFGPFPIGVYAKHIAIFRRLN